MQRILVLKNSFHFFNLTSLFRPAVQVRLPAGVLLYWYSECDSDAVSHLGFVILFMRSFWWKGETFFSFIGQFNNTDVNKTNVLQITEPSDLHFVQSKNSKLKSALSLTFFVFLVILITFLSLLAKTMTSSWWAGDFVDWAKLSFAVISLGSLWGQMRQLDGLHFLRESIG